MTAMIHALCRKVDAFTDWADSLFEIVVGLWTCFILDIFPVLFLFVAAMWAILTVLAWLIEGAQ